VQRAAAIHLEKGFGAQITPRFALQTAARRLHHCSLIHTQKQNTFLMEIVFAAQMRSAHRDYVCSLRAGAIFRLLRQEFQRVGRFKKL
jgi:hypothetical protein